MREFLRNIFVGAALAVSAVTANASDLEVFKKQVVEPVVQLNRNCSGVVIETDSTKTYILTALHCVEGTKSGWLMIDTKQRQKVIKTENYVYDVIQRDATNDLAFLRVREEGLNLQGAVIASEDPVEGETVWAVGYPLGWTRTITQGFVGGYESINSSLSGFDEFGNERALLRATAPITGGNSGGGLFAKFGDHYELVGISDAAVPKFAEAAMFVPTEAINAIVKGALLTETTVSSPKVPALPSLPVQQKKAD